MTFLINPFLFTAAAAADWYAACTSGNTDVYDELAIQSAGTFTIPSAWNGRKVRAGVGGIVGGGSDVQVTISKNGASFDGRGDASFPNVAGVNEGGTAFSAPVEVSTGDTFTMSTGGGGGDGSWKSIELLPNGVKGALVNRITSAFAVTSSGTVVEWNNEVYDTDGFHDNSTNPSRLTVQSGTSGLVRIQTNIKTSGSLSQIFLQILQNGSEIYSHESTNQELNIFTPPIPVSAGDYFEVRVTPNTNVNVNVDGASWMALEELPSGLRYAIAAGSTDTLPTGAVWTQVTDTSESVDVGNWHASGTMTVISDVTRVRVGFFGSNSVGIPSALEQAIFKNGSDFNLAPHNAQNSAGDEYRHAVSPVLEVSPGDAFTVWVRTGAGAQKGDGTMWIEEVPEVT